MIHLTTVYRIVRVPGVAILYLMNVISVVATTAFVLTVPAFQTVLHMKMSVMFVMMIHLTTVCRTVPVFGAEVQRKRLIIKIQMVMV